MSMTRTKYLHAELERYLSGKVVSTEEANELHAWVDAGFSVYSNPWHMTGEDGGELDYLTARQDMLDLAEQAGYSR